MKRIYQNKIMEESWVLSGCVAVFVLVIALLLREVVVGDFGIPFYVFLFGFIVEVYAVYVHQLKLKILLNSVE